MKDMRESCSILIFEVAENKVVDNKFLVRIYTIS